MKKWTVMILVLALVLAMTACGASEKEQERMDGGFRVGCGRVDITPIYSVPIGGYGDERVSTGAFEPLYATCIAITDAQDSTVLIYTLDMGNITELVADSARNVISSKVGVAYENIVLNCSHTHSGVEYRTADNSASQRYCQDLVIWCVEAAEQALQDRSPATVSMGSTQTNGMNWVRRYKLSDGSYGGDNFGDFSVGIDSHESQVDQQMQIIRIAREAGKDIILANWQAHATVLSSGKSGSSSHKEYYELSPDFIGPFRRAVEAELDCVCLYVQGASGNVNPFSRIEDETFSKDVNVYGKELARYLIEAQDTLEPCETGLVKVNTYALEAACNHSQDSKYVTAVEARTHYLNNGNDQTFRDMLAAAGLNSIHHCNGIITNYQLEATDTIELTTISIGSDIGFACFPYEMFDTEGMYIKENSPFATTFVVGYSNGFFAYIPNDTGWENGGYERDITKFVQGTAEACAQKLVDMLSQQHGD